MENNFQVDYQGEKKEVSYQQGDKPNEYLFTVGDRKLQCKKDSDGAYRWLDAEGNPSDEATDIGTTIETYLMEHHINL
jgi:hypothetical protein